MNGHCLQQAPLSGLEPGQAGWWNGEANSPEPSPNLPTVDPGQHWLSPSHGGSEEFIGRDGNRWKTVAVEAVIWPIDALSLGVVVTHHGVNKALHASEGTKPGLKCPNQRF